MRLTELKDKVYDSAPTPILVSEHHLRRDLDLCRSAVQKSFVSFDYVRFTPLIRKVFPTLDVGVEDSEVEVPVAPRPMKRKRDGSYKPHGRLTAMAGGRTSLPRRAAPNSVCDWPSSSSDEKHEMAECSVSDVVLEAMDTTTNEICLFVTWSGHDLSSSSWIPHSNLNPELLSWWQLEREVRFPGVEYEKIRPRLSIVTSVPDVPSSPTSPPSPASSSSSSSSSSFEDDNAWEIEGILDERTFKGVRKYRVRWKNFTGQCSWLTRDQVNSEAMRIWEVKKSKK